MTPTLLIINGTSSAGKSTLARAFQAQSSRQWMRLALDDFFDMFPPGANYTNVPYERFLDNFYRTVAQWAGDGFDLIVDTVFEREACVQMMLEYLQAFRIYLIGLHCPLAEVERREQARGNRPAGLARQQFQQVHLYTSYDLELSSFQTLPEANVRQVQALLQTVPRAFRAMQDFHRPPLLSNS